MQSWRSTQLRGRVISDDAPVILLDSEEDVVRHRKIKEAAECFTKKKKRSAKVGRIIDRLHEWMNNKENWKHLQSKNEYLYPGTFSNISSQYVIFIPDIDKIQPKGAVDDFIWRDIQLSKGRTNLPRDIKVTIDGQEETLKY